MDEIAIEGGTTPAVAVAQKPRRARVGGVEFESLGQVWALAHVGLARGFDEERDAVYDDLTMHGDVDVIRMFTVAYAQLVANYDLTKEEVGAIIRGADRKKLIEAIAASLIFSEHPEEKKTYSYWARTALIANGIDPAKVEPGDVAGVLAHLVASGRAMPDEKFTAAGRFQAVRSELLG